MLVVPPLLQFFDLCPSLRVGQATIQQYELPLHTVMMMMVLVLMTVVVAMVMCIYSAYGHDNSCYSGNDNVMMLGCWSLKSWQHAFTAA